MPVDFLTEAERERWQRLPDTMPQDDLFVFFLLSDEDRQETQRQRDPQNRLGYALQLCILRYLGFVPDDLQATPHEVVAFVAEQLEIDPSVLTLYASRRRTQTDHQLHVQCEEAANPDGSSAPCTGLLEVSSSNTARFLCFAHLVGRACART